MCKDSRKEELNGLNGLKVLGDLTIARTYAKTKENGKKETWDEVSERYLNFMAGEYPYLKEAIFSKGGYIKNKMIVPSMRLLQFSDVAKRNHVRGYNCSYINVTSYEAFRELPWLLSCGAGVGVGLLKRFTDQIPKICEGFEVTSIVEDTKEGWAYSFENLIKNPKLQFDYSLLRPAGSPLVSSGGVASGPEPLIKAHEEIRKILKNRVGDNLKPIDVLDIVCLQAESIVSGGSRRSAIISLFDADDEEMLKAKTGNWFDTHLHRSKSNNSAVIFREDPEAKEKLEYIMGMAISGWGEPGVVWHVGRSEDVSDEEFQGVNPCAEISLCSQSFCNLSEVLAPNCHTKSEFIESVKAAAFFGTLQAGLTEFPFLNPKWVENAKRDALLGVSITGQAMAQELLSSETLREGAEAVKRENEHIASIIGINPAKRTTCVKPSGTTGAALGVTSGIHAAHSKFFIRRVRANKESPLGKYLIDNFGIVEGGFVEQDIYNTRDVVFSVPCKVDNTITRDEGVISLLERSKMVKTNWINPGHREGLETHNVSITASYKDEEKDGMLKWFWDNRELYRGISILKDDNDYPQLPYEQISEERYSELVEVFPEIDVEGIIYEDSSRMQQVACSGGSCEVSF